MYKEYKENYLVYDTGEIVKKDTKEHLKIYYMGAGYPCVRINKKNEYVHRIIAEMFCEKPAGKRVEVDHIDGNKNNNCANNLRWITHSENVKAAIKLGLFDKTLTALKENNEKNKIKVAAVKNGQVVAIYNSINDAAQENGVYSQNICRSIKNGGKCGGYEWQKA